MLTVVIAAIGLLILVEGAIGWIWGNEINFMPSAFPAHVYHVRGVTFSLQDIGTIGVSLASVVVLWVFFQFTKVGLAMRAAAVRPEAARLVGVRVSWMLSLGWGLAAVLGAVAGMMAAAEPERPAAAVDDGRRPHLRVRGSRARRARERGGAVVGGLADRRRCSTCSRATWAG